MNWRDVAIEKRDRPMALSYTVKSVKSPPMSKPGKALECGKKDPGPNPHSSPNDRCTSQQLAPVFARCLGCSPRPTSHSMGRCNMCKLQLQRHQLGVGTGRSSWGCLLVAAAERKAAHHSHRDFLSQKKKTSKLHVFPSSWSESHKHLSSTLNFSQLEGPPWLTFLLSQFLSLYPIPCLFFLFRLP